MGQFQMGLLCNNNCICDVHNCKISRNNCKSPKSNQGVQTGWSMGSKQHRVQIGLFYTNHYI